MNDTQDRSTFYEERRLIPRLTTGLISRNGGNDGEARKFLPITPFLRSNITRSIRWPTSRPVDDSSSVAFPNPYDTDVGNRRLC